MSGNWMDDPAVARIDKAKLNFLQALVFESQSLKKEQMMPFLMSIAKRGMDQHISFSNDEIETPLRSATTPHQRSLIRLIS